ncbi:hypothetical protein EMPS_06805 [Entomortierella parvispora]|uniref:Uncharacterized protein n=1 Tax=Entomortierella parvispora TaxID=205924 RepID=A0A9P3HDN8_9FUNG|nr:hypothetical protein EMPS_06805 [Entomortierella parvispora]
MSNGHSSDGPSAQMAADPVPLDVRMAQLEQQLAALIGIHQKSTGDFDPELFPLQSTLGYVPNQNFIDLTTFGSGCLLKTPFCLAPLAPSEKAAFAARSPAIVGYDYSTPVPPEGLSLPAELKAHDKQLSDIQFQLSQTTKYLDYFMERTSRVPQDRLPFLTVMEHLAGIRRLLSGQASAISQTRLDNIVRWVNPKVKNPPQVSSASAPYLVETKVMADLLAVMETNTRIWQPQAKSSEPGSSRKGRARPKKKPRGRSPEAKTTRSASSQPQAQPEKSSEPVSSGTTRSTSSGPKGKDKSGFSRPPPQSRTQ